MKTKIIIGLVLLFLALGTYLWLRGGALSETASNSSAGTEKENDLAGNQSSSPAAPVSQSEQDAIDFASVLSPEAKARLATGYVLSAEQREELVRKKRQIDFFPTAEERHFMMKTPVEFYGQVLDQFDQPVIGAKIRCTREHIGRPMPALELKSAGPNGEFEVLGTEAQYIHISVYPPPGYDENISVSKVFAIARAPERLLQNEDYKKLTPEQRAVLLPTLGAEKAYKGDKAKPEIFRLKKL